MATVSKEDILVAQQEAEDAQQALANALDRLGGKVRASSKETPQTASRTALVDLIDGTKQVIKDIKGQIKNFGKAPK